VTDTARVLLADEECRELFDILLGCTPCGSYEDLAATPEAFGLWTGWDMDTVHEHLEHLDLRQYLDRHYVWTPDGRRVLEGFWLTVPGYVEDVARWRVEEGEEVESRLTLLRAIGERVDDGTSIPWALYAAGALLGCPKDLPGTDPDAAPEAEGN
jgi:hypothetical protein